MAGHARGGRDTHPGANTTTSFLAVAGFSAIRITTTRRAGDGLHSTIIEAVKPAMPTSR
jgi:hypothetical protein